MGQYVFEKIDNIFINCEAAFKPDGWSDAWDENWQIGLYKVSVVWGAKDPATLKTFTFITNGGSAVEPITDEALYECPVTTKTGEAFVGWFDNEMLTGEPISFPYKGEATVFYAKWTPRDGSSFEKAIEIELNQFGSGWYSYTSTKEMYFTFTVPESYDSLEFFQITVDNQDILQLTTPDYNVYDRFGNKINYTVSKETYALSGSSTYYIKVEAAAGEQISVSVEKT